MGLNIDNENVYIRTRMAQLPEPTEDSEHVIKRGESLWSLAEKAVGKSAKRNEKSDFMLMIAKLNNLDTAEEMNKLNIGQVIKMPALNPASHIAKANSKQTKVSTPSNNTTPNAKTKNNNTTTIKPNKTNTKKIVTNKPPQQNTAATKPKSEDVQWAEKACNNFYKTLSNGELSVVESKLFFMFHPENQNRLFQIYAKDKNSQMGKKLLAMVNTSNNNEITNITIYIRKPGKTKYDIPTSMSYNIKDYSINRVDACNIEHAVPMSIDKQEMNQAKQKLTKLIQKSIN